MQNSPTIAMDSGARGVAIAAEKTQGRLPGPIRNRWALLVGINHYVDPGILDLRFCVNDALALQSVLRNLNYETVALHDDATAEHLLPTQTNIFAELARLCAVADSDDLLWIHFTGHGLVEEEQPLLVAADTRLPILSRSALAISDIEKQMRNSKAHRQILTVDACHAGVDLKRGLTNAGFIQHVYELAEGFALIAASAREQVAYESTEKQHGVFTYYLLDGLGGAADHEQKGFVTVADLQAHTLDNLRRWSFEHGDLIQVPTARVEGVGDIILADYRRDSPGPVGPLVDQAEALLNVFAAAQQAIMHRIFLRLVQLGDREPDTRRRQPIAALRSVQDAPTMFEPTLHRLLATGLLIRSPAGNSGEEYVEPAHEGLIREWPTLQVWLREGRTAETIRRKYEAQALEWTRRGGGMSGLLDVGEYGEVVSKLQRAGQIIGYSPELEKFMGRSLIQLLVTVALPVMAVVTVAVWVLIQWWDVNEARAHASAPLVVFSAGMTTIGPDYDRGGPILTPTLGAFGIEKYEVSNARYCLCYQNKACDAPPDSQACSTKGDVAVAGVTLSQAARFCQWIGRRLPTEFEWERAARGTTGRPWPWGTGTPTAREANMWTADGGKSTGPEPVATRTESASPEGVMDLVGNVAEWTASYAVPYTQPIQQVYPTPADPPISAVVQRGGGWDSQWHAITQRDYVVPEFVGDSPHLTSGFRCAATGP